MTQNSSLRMALCLCVVLSACARQSGIPALSNSEAGSGAHSGGQESGSRDSNSSTQANSSETNQTSTEQTKNEAAAKAQPNFYQRFLSHFGDNLVGLAEAAVGRSTSEDKVRAEVSRKLVAQDAQRRAPPENVQPINENAPSLTKENAALLGESHLPIRTKFIEMLTAPNLSEAIVKADDVTSDLWSNVDQASNKFSTLTDTIGMMENLKIYDRATAQRVAILTGKIDRHLKADESGSALGEIAAVSVLGAGLAVGGELKTLRRIEIENFKNGVGESAIGHALRGTHGFSEYAASHGHDIVIPMLAASDVDVKVLNEMQLRVIDSKKLNSVAMTPSRDPHIEYAIIKQTRVEHLGTDRAILLKVKPDGMGEPQFLVTQRLWGRTANTISDGLARTEAQEAAAFAEESAAHEVAQRGPRPRVVRLDEAEAKNIGIDLTDDVFAKGGPEAELARLEAKSEIASGATEQPIATAATSDVEIPLVENGAANTESATAADNYEVALNNARSRTDLPLWQEARGLAKSPVTATNKLNSRTLARNFALFTIPIGGLDYVAHQNGYGEGVVSSDYFLESRLSAERIRELHAPAKDTK